MALARYQMLWRLAAVLLFLAIAASLAAAQRPSKPNRPTSGPVLSDQALERAIAQRFSNSKIAANGFTVQVAGGVATLRGKAGVAQHKGVATRLAKAAGARTVLNQIELSDAARETMRKLSSEKRATVGTKSGSKARAAKPELKGNTKPPPQVPPASRAIGEESKQAEEAATSPVPDTSKKRGEVRDARGEARNPPPKRFRILPESRNGPGQSAAKRERTRRY